MAQYHPPEIVGEAIRKYDEAKKHHDVFVRRYERGERAYRGILDRASDAAKWKHDLHPPYGFNLIETIVSNTVEQGLRFGVRPAPHVNVSLEEAQQMVAQSESVEYLLRHEHRVDHMDEKQRPLYLSMAIGGRGVGKTYWNYVEGARKRQGVQNVAIHGPSGDVIGEVPTIVEIEEQGILRDHSTTEIVDPRDFILHESAQHLDPFAPGGAQHLFHRCWYSFEQLKMLERAEYVQNVDQLKHTLDFSSEYADRETELWNINRTKDLIEVLEYWCFKDGKVYSSWVGNRMILLKDEEANPFWHGGYPFFMARSMPLAFSQHGMSEIELIEALQEILWELMNQRLDNVELINNAIMLIRSDVDDPDAFEHYPGARWPVDDTSQVEPLIPPYQVAEISLQAEALLKGDLQNVTSAAPFAGGAQTATVDQKTATGASIVMNAAQQRLAAKKWQAQLGLRDEANMRIKNCQQFIDPSSPRLVHIIGPGGAMAFREMSVLDIQGEYITELTAMGEAEQRQERRAEATQFAQILLGMAPLAAAAGTPLDLREVIKDFFHRWEVDDAERFFAHDPQGPAAGAVQGLQPSGQGNLAGMGIPGQLQGGDPNLGVTAGSAVDASKPSATGGLSMSGQMFMQRAAQLATAGRGGAANQ